VSGRREVPFNKVHVGGAELEYIADAISNTRLSGNGPYGERCARWLEEKTGARRALLTHSGTGALEMAAILAGIGPGDEVVMPSFTFTSTANAVVLRGATPVFVDIRKDTLNIDDELVAAAITPRTKALLPVHYAGVAAELGSLVALARAHDLVLIEDSAQALLATYEGRPLGGFGDLAALSFHETKNLICGEGGALLVNRPDLVERAEIVHEKGTDRRRFFRGEIDKYSWIDAGSSFVLSELQAAFLWAQLEHAEEIQASRQRAWAAYDEGLAELARDGLLRQPVVPPAAAHNAHLYYVLLPDRARRDGFIAGLAERGVHAVFHYVPLHSSVGGRQYGRASGELPVTDDVSARLVRLPLWAGMTESDTAAVIDAVHDVLTAFR
jgi:dTDP-4-amino-4,6-dideoxygalactose transaminase